MYMYAPLAPASISIVIRVANYMLLVPANEGRTFKNIHLLRSRHKSHKILVDVTVPIYHIGRRGPQNKDIRKVILGRARRGE